MIGVVMRGAEEERGRSVGQGKTHDDRVSLVVACHREESHSGVAILQGHGRVVVAGSGYVALGENWSKVTCPLPRGKEAGETWGTQRVEVGSVNIAGNQTEVWGRSDGFPAVSSVRTPPAAAEVEEESGHAVCGATTEQWKKRQHRKVEGMELWAEGVVLYAYAPWALSVSLGVSRPPIGSNGGASWICVSHRVLPCQKFGRRQW